MTNLRPGRASRMCRALLLYCPVFAVSSTSTFAEELPDRIVQLLQRYCVDCHGSEAPEAGITLQVDFVDWSDRHNLERWERILKAVHSSKMPPAESDALSSTERSTLENWIDQTLTKNSPIGGTLARRLNRDEYKASIETLFGLRDFNLPHGFPPDREFHGFDNLGEGLVLSPPLLEAYNETARLVADQVFPAEISKADPGLRHAGLSEGQRRELARSGAGRSRGLVHRHKCAVTLVRRHFQAGLV